jgi:hypothetical protein
MGDIELAAEIGRIGRHGHRFGGQDRVDGSSAYVCVGREPIEGLADDGGDGHPAALGLACHLAVTLVVEEDLHAVVQHAHTVAHV